MMKRIILYALLSLIAIETSVQTLSAQNRNKKDIVEVRKTAPFQAISVSAGIDVYLTQSPRHEVVVRSDKETISLVTTTVQGNTLHISFRKNSRRVRNSHTVVEISMPALEAIKASSASDVKIRGYFEGKSLRINASSSADVEGGIRYNDIAIDASSGSDVELYGEVDYCTANASSGSDIDLEQLICFKADAKASSGADISIYIKDYITATASSGAEITVYGNPRVLTSNTSSGGKVKPKK